MRNRIFFCEEEEEVLRGPFSERDMQQQYREKKIGLAARIYFTNGDTPASTAKSYTLLDLRSRCGTGCPFIDPESMPNPLDRVPSADEMMLKNIKMGIVGIRAKFNDLDELEAKVRQTTMLPQAIGLLESGSATEDSYDAIREGRKIKDINNNVTQTSSPMDDSFIMEPTLHGLSRKERLQRLIEGISSVRSTIFSALSLNERVKRADEAWRSESIDAMRVAAYNNLSIDVGMQPTGVPEVLNSQTLLDSMNSDEIPDISLIDFEKVPEKPKSCTRAYWLQHVKMAKKLAGAVSDTCLALRTGSSRTIDYKHISTTIMASREWFEKWEHGPLQRQIGALVDHELVKRLREVEYFYCFFCNKVQFNVKQGLSHFSGNYHCKKMNEVPESNLRGDCFAYVTSTLQIVTRLAQELHDTYTAQYTMPLLKSGMKVPAASKDSIPTADFMKNIKKKYESRINGEIDSGRLNDPTYVATVVRGIVSRHKSAIGRQMFKEFDEYFRKGTNFYCTRCMWMLTSRERFYKHINNPIHIDCVMNEKKGPPMTFCLLTFSVNIHASDAN